MRRTSLLCTCAALVLSSHLALAETADETAARSLFREGLALHEAHDYAGAIQKYFQAYARWKNPKILMNIGTASFELGRYAEAAVAYDQFLAATDARDPNRAEVEKALREVLPKVGTFDVRVNGGTAVVTVDGHTAEGAFLDRLRVEPGSHVVEAIGAGGIRAKETATAVAGTTVVVTLTPTATPANQPSSATATATASSSAPPEPPRKLPVLPFVVAGAGVGVIITSGVFFALRGSAETDLEHQCISKVCPSSSQGTIDRANTFGLVGGLLLAAGIAGVGAGVYFYFRPPESDSPTSLELHAGAAPGLGRVTTTLRF